MKAWPSQRVFPAVLAHQGGWDEIALVAGPLLVVGFALWLANRRASAQLKQSNRGTPSDNDG